MGRGRGCAPRNRTEGTGQWRGLGVPSLGPPGSLLGGCGVAGGRGKSTALSTLGGCNRLGGWHPGCREHAHLWRGWGLSSSSLCHQGGSPVAQEDSVAP